MSDPVTTVDYVRAAIGGDAVKAKEIFNQLMSPKVVDAIDVARNEVAQNYFGHAPKTEEPVSAEETEENTETSDEASTEEDNSENSESDTKEEEEPANEDA